MIYILQFERPLGTALHSAQYYIGYCEDNRLEQRLAEHRMGRGAAMTRFAVANQIDFYVVAALPGDRRVERQLKRQKNCRRVLDRIRRDCSSIVNEN